MFTVGQKVYIYSSERIGVITSITVHEYYDEYTIETEVNGEKQTCCLGAHTFTEYLPGDYVKIRADDDDNIISGYNGYVFKVVGYDAVPAYALKNLKLECPSSVITLYVSERNVRRAEITPEEYEAQKIFHFHANVETSIEGGTYYHRMMHDDEVIFEVGDHVETTYGGKRVIGLVEDMLDHVVPMARINVIEPVHMMNMRIYRPACDVVRVDDETKDRLLNTCMCCGRRDDLVPVYWWVRERKFRPLAVCRECRSYARTPESTLPRDERDIILATRGRESVTDTLYGLDPDSDDLLRERRLAFQYHVFVCACCGECELTDDRRGPALQTELNYCESCFRAQPINYCIRCTEPHLTTSMVYAGACGYCSRTDCLNEYFEIRERRSRQAMRYMAHFIHYYSYKPDPKFKRLEDETPDYYGVELEIDGRNAECEDCSYDLHDADPDEDLYYQKHDGSLGRNGIEIVTHPCTYEYHMAAFPWEKVTELATIHKYKSHDTTTCGMHIHVSRTAFGDTESEQDMNIAKTIFLFDRYWTQLVNFSRRQEVPLEHYASKPESDITSGDSPVVVNDKVKKFKQSPNRYRAINLLNENTVEFRIFRGTLNVSTIKAAIQFLHGMIQYVRNHSMLDVYNAQWMDIACGNNEPELIEYLKTRGLFIGQVAMNLDPVTDYNN